MTSYQILRGINIAADIVEITYDAAVCFVRCFIALTVIVYVAGEFAGRWFYEWHRNWVGTAWQSTAKTPSAESTPTQPLSCHLDSLPVTAPMPTPTASAPLLLLPAAPLPSASELLQLTRKELMQLILAA